MINRIIFDVDGTLVDSSDRLYRLFCDLTNDRSLSKRDYWDLKRSKHPHEEILKNAFRWNEKRIKEFKNKWMSLIETEEYISLDKPYPTSLPVLKALATAGKFLYVLTARQNPEIAKAELTRYGFGSYLDDILVTGPSQDKRETLLSSLGVLGRGDLIVGDTGHDINLARSMNVTSVAVDYGFVSGACLQTYAPDYLISDLSQLISLIGV